MRITYWMIAIAILIGIMLYTGVKADGAFVSIEGESGRVTVTYNLADKDSTWVVFSSPLSGTPYDSVKCVPKYAGTRFLEGSGLILDSVGVHSFVAKGFAADTWADTIQGTWANGGAIIAEPGSGPGIFACSTLVLNTGDSTIVPNAAIEIRPDGGTAQLAYIDDIGADGFHIFAMNPGNYDYYIAAMVGFTISNPTDITISGNQTDTLWMDLFDFVVPPAGFVNVFTYYITPRGDTIQPSTITYQYVASAGTTYSENTRLTLATGVVLEKGRLTERINKTSPDSAFFSFPLVSNFDVFVDGVQDSSSWVEFKMFGKLKTRVLVQVPKPGPFNPFAP